MHEYLKLNAELNIIGDNGEIQTDKDKEAARQYFLEHVNPNTVFFHTLAEKVNYMTEQGYWDEELFRLYTFDEVKSVFRHAYDHKFRFPTFVGAYKFYTSYALKNYAGDRYLERYEDRVSMVALNLARGDVGKAKKFVDEMVTGRFQPATPTFLNAGRADAGDLVSCFLLRIEDNMESIGRSITNALQLSKRGGGVALLLTNIREEGAPIKNVEGASSGVVPIMKLLEDSFSYANQLGARQGAGAVYLNAHHPDILKFLDTKRENADEKIRIKTLSLGVVVPDITFELARQGKDMYLFSPYDVEVEYGVPFSDLSVTEHYDAMVENPRIRKTKISARKLFQTIAEIQFESGYPYLLFEDTANRANPVCGRINMSNLCVAPETRLLTDQGYFEIQDLDGMEVNAWNGKQFSKSLVAKTGEDQKLITVNFSNGASLDVTPYHKFYVQNTYHGKAEEVRAGELQPGDKLAKFDLAVVDNDAEDFPHAYTAGFFTADGTYTQSRKPKVCLYGEKKDLVDYLDIKSGSYKEDASGRLSFMLPDTVPAKYQVPLGYSLSSRLDWLAGLVDGDGSGNGIVGVQIVSTNHDFLNEVRVMLTTLGVHSKVVEGNKGGLRRFKEGQKEYMCSDAFRLVIPGTETQKLVELGIPTKRVILEPYEHQRSATQFVTVVDVVDNGRVSDTYCLNEPLEHKVVFEGVQTGNCSEILQVNTPSEFNENGEYMHVGQDISCNLGSMNIAAAMADPGHLPDAVATAVDALTSVVHESNIQAVPPIAKANQLKRSIGLGQMNLHGFLAQNKIHYGSEESIEFVHAYFSLVRYHALKRSCDLARKHGSFDGFLESGYATGEALTKYEETDYRPTSPRIKELFDGVEVPGPEVWAALSESIQLFGLYHSYLLAVPPTGNISYVNGSTPSIHPVTGPVEIRKEGKMGRVYYPAPGLDRETLPYYTDAYSVGYEKLIDVYAAATEHTDQGLSLTLFLPSTATTRDLNKAQIYAWRKGIKTMYYLRTRQEALEGTGVDTCLSCSL